MTSTTRPLLRTSAIIVYILLLGNMLPAHVASSTLPSSLSADAGDHTSPTHPWTPEHITTTRRLQAARSTRTTRRRRTRTKPVTLQVPATPTAVSLSVDNTSTQQAPTEPQSSGGIAQTGNVVTPGADDAVAMATASVKETNSNETPPARPRVQRTIAVLPQPGDDGGEDAPPGPHKMLIVSAVQPNPCDAGVGNYVNLLSIKNKEMYAKVHNYGLQWSFNIYDPMLQGPWNKVAVLINLLHSVDAAQYEWLLWVDYDAIFGDMDVTIPFERYDGKDLIFLGDEAKLLEGDAVGGLNSGVMLIRVSEWSQRFFTELASFGAKWWDWSDKMETLKTSLKNFAKPLYEQNAVAYMMMRDHRYHDRVFLENGDVFVLHTSFDVVPLMKAALGNNHNPLLVIHWSGCQFCKPQTAQNNFQWCLEEFLKRWTEANEQGSLMLGEGYAVQIKDLMPMFRSRAASAWVDRGTW